MRFTRSSALAIALTGALVGVSARAAPAPAPAQPDGAAMVEAARAGKPLWATIETTKGPIVVELSSSAAPQSVAAFVGYATGALGWKERGQLVQRPLYPGTIFHRVIPGFGIQGGDPSGTGNGGPGQTTPDDTKLPAQQALHFTKGSVGMPHLPDASGNGSQFFILTGDAPWLDGRYTQLGRVISGLAVAEAIASAPRGPQDRPLQPVSITSIRITDRPPKLGRRK